MALIRWEPVRELNTIQSEMNRLFNTFFEAPQGGHQLRRWIPAMDLVESGDEFVLRADLPGLTEKDVSIELDDNVLTVSGERKSEREDRKEGYYRVERASGSFSRSLTLPEGVDADRVAASFDHGVLEVRIPKPQARKPRKVSIAVSGSEDKVIEGQEAGAPVEAADGAAPEAGNGNGAEPELAGNAA